MLMFTTEVLSQSSGLPDTSEKVLKVDGDLPICRACCTQYTIKPTDCPVCEDERQFVPPTGQSWTSLNDLVNSEHANELLRDKEDPRISLISTKPSTGIAQTPILIETSESSYIWDCNAFISAPLIGHLLDLKRSLKAIAISHPHFYSTSLTWARALGVPLYIASQDRSWYRRLEEVKEGEIVWYDDTVDLQHNVRLIRCGGHFPGSAMMYWDRSKEPSNGENSDLPDSGIMFCSDTALVQPHRKGFTFQYSPPNMIPMNPYDMQSIYLTLLPYKFDQATSTWPNKWIREEADEKLRKSILRQLEHMGLKWEPPEMGSELELLPPSEGLTQWRTG